MALVTIEIIIKKGVDIKGRYPFPNMKTGAKVEVSDNADISEVKVAGEKITAISDKYTKEIDASGGVRIVTSNALV
jgi:hypothetical protein